MPLAAVMLLAACSTPGEQLAELDAAATRLSAPQIDDLPHGSFFATLETRKGVTQKFALIKAKEPVANVLLFAGGHGVLELIRTTSSRPGLGRADLRYNFLIRAKEEFITRGLNVILIDAPSDRQGRSGMLGGFRGSARHLKDLEAVIGLIRQRTDLPVWLVGTSRGTESAAYAAAHSRVPVDGLVLTSPISVSSGNGSDIRAFDLANIRAPVQVVYHERDGCRVTPPEGARAIARALPNAARVEIKSFSGGGPAVSEPCEAQSEHGFLHLEGTVVEAIANFIKANTKP